MEEDERRKNEEMRRKATEEGMKEGMKKGRLEGMKEGIKEGRKKGMEKGEQKKQIEIARKMRRTEYPLIQLSNTRVFNLLI